MKTPREVIAETNIDHKNRLGHDFAHYIEERLGAAGFVIVPREPTQDMLERGLEGFWPVIGTGDHPTNGARMDAGYRAMIDAAQKKN